MLTFSANPNHVFERLQERTTLTPGVLLHWIAEINRYLPDDWRATRSASNFKIQIVSTRFPKDRPCLVGRSLRAPDGEVLLNIDSVHLAHFIDNFAPVQVGVDLEARRRNPDRVRPNLYFFDPCPDNFISPVFARQYEKVKIDSKGTPAYEEYHRVHPLLRSGLDQQHYLWLRWDVHGNVTRVPEPPGDFHGRDYYLAEGITARDRDLRKRSYSKTMNDHGVNVSSPEPPPVPRYEREYKYLMDGNVRRVEIQVRTIAERLQLTRVLSATKTQADEYFDDAKLTLHAAGASFRVRRSKDATRVTLKKRNTPASPAKAGYYERIEEEAVIREGEYRALAAGKPLHVWPYRLIDYIVRDCGSLQSVMTVSNKRKTLVFEDGAQNRVECCFDEVYYHRPRRAPLGPYWELEIESKGLDRERMAEFADAIEQELGLLPSLQSKYERGVSLRRTSPPPDAESRRKRKVILDTDCGVDDAIALILAMKAEELNVLAVTCVAGNVGLDKVIVNVRRVMAQLQLNRNPILAAGADRPLEGEPIVAESVHGSDGLGDCADYPDPGQPELDARPAWRVICDLATKHPNEVTLITVGPMTNLALAIQERPEDVRRLKEVAAMGGVFFAMGNVQPDAEFNVAADPAAAKICVEFCRDSCLLTPVDAAGSPVDIDESPDAHLRIKAYQDRRDANEKVPLTFVGLDVTHQVLLRRAVLERLWRARRGASPLLRFVRDISRKYMDFYYGNEGLPGCYLHDPLAVAYVINPGFLGVSRHIVQVETRGQFTNGMIFPDDRPTRNPRWRNPAEAVIGVAHRVEREAFEEYVIRMLCS